MMRLWINPKWRVDVWLVIVGEVRLRVSREVLLLLNVERLRFDNMLLVPRVGQLVVAYGMFTMATVGQSMDWLGIVVHCVMLHQILQAIVCILVVRLVLVLVFL